MDESYIEFYKTLLRDVTLFSAEGSSIRLRNYQVQVAQSIVDYLKKLKK